MEFAGIEFKGSSCSPIGFLHFLLQAFLIKHVHLPFYILAMLLFAQLAS